MGVRVKHPREHSLIALVVICFLGVIAIVTSIGSLTLVHEAIVYVPPNGQTIDAAVVALIGQQVTIALTSITALGVMLTSTSPKPPPIPMLPATSQSPESVPMTLVNPDPLPTAPQPLPDPEPPAAGPIGDEGEPDPVPEPAPPVRPRRRSSGGS